LTLTVTVNQNTLALFDADLTPSSNVITLDIQ
jgi:hypothetical protein